MTMVTIQAVALNGLVATSRIQFWFCYRPYENSVSPSYPVTRLTLLMETLHTTHEIERKTRWVATQNDSQLVRIDMLLSKREALAVLAVAQEITSKRNAAT